MNLLRHLRLVFKITVRTQNSNGQWKFYLIVNLPLFWLNGKSFANVLWIYYGTSSSSSELHCNCSKDWPRPAILRFEVNLLLLILFGARPCPFIQIFNFNTYPDYSQLFPRKNIQENIPGKIEVKFRLFMQIFHF